MADNEEWKAFVLKTRIEEAERLCYDLDPDRIEEVAKALHHLAVEQRKYDREQR